MNTLGDNLFPPSGYLYVVWDAFCKTHRKVLKSTKVLFEDVKFNKTTTVPKDGYIKFIVSFRRSNGFFEVFI